MASQDFYTDIDLFKVSQLLNTRIHNVTTAERTALAALLGVVNKGLIVWDTTLNLTFYWNGAGWTNGVAPVAPPVWGSITGVLSNQTDLQAELDDKVNILDLATVAFTGDYNDLTNTPTIPPATTPAGANTEIQYNNGGIFGASSDFIWNNVTKVLNINGNTIVQNLKTGSAAPTQTGTIKKVVTDDNGQLSFVEDYSHAFLSIYQRNMQNMCSYY